MANQWANAASIFDIKSQLKLVGFFLGMMLVTGFVALPQAQAQSLTVLHNFTGGADGGFPFAGITFDPQGRIYGTAAGGGSHQDGVVYRLVREGQAWVLSPIYSFQGEPDGAGPYSRVVFGPDGLLYGTTYEGGAENLGTVFSLRPPATACKSVLCPWVETVLYSFTNGADGASPEYGDLSFDQDGNIYGTAYEGGRSGNGVVFKLTPSGSGWTESVLWNFTAGSDGAYPLSGVIFDSAGNLYGTTSYAGGHRLGTVYELSPSQSGWSETTLYSFTNSDNGSGAGGLIMDAHGDLFGITGSGVGAAYELTPQDGSWSFTLLQTFSGGGYPPNLAAPTLDSQGNLYGPLPSGGDGFGEIFKLAPSGNQWTYSPLYQSASCNDGNGCFPIGAVTFDANGNMYGTTEEGGTGYGGTVWEITP